jgi:predicted regulator of Ras-like GTPase activity (Roadblock/LC7/MglB family)
MNFEKILKEAVDRVDGAFSAMILGIDGMPVETHTVEKILNLESLSAESSQMIRGINSAAESLGLGDAREFSIISDLCGIIMRRINQEYYMAILIKPEGNVGKGRFVLKNMVAKVKGDF